MDDKNITDRDRQAASHQSFFSGIVFDRMETYDASKQNCLTFYESGRSRVGMDLPLANRRSGYPFLLCGRTYTNSELAYNCGAFSLNTPLHIEIQRKLVEERNGFLSRQSAQRLYGEHRREDWEEFQQQWMLYVIWRKCLGNADFRNLLLSLPSDAVLILNNTIYRTDADSRSNLTWGTKNDEQKRVDWNLDFNERHYFILKPEDWEEVKQKRANIHRVGHFVGQNNMGKIMMLCKIALENHIVPPIDFELLRAKKIYLFGELVTFENEEYVED